MADWILAFAELGEAATAFVNERLPFRRGRDAEEPNAVDDAGGTAESSDHEDGDIDD